MLTGDDEVASLRAALTAVEARAEKAEGELREVRDAVNAVLDRASGDHIGGVTVVRVPLIRAALSSPSAVTPEPTEDEWNWGDPESDDWTAFSPHPYRNAHRQGMNDCWCGVGPRNEIHRRPVTPEPAEPERCEHGSTVPHVDDDFLTGERVICPGPSSAATPAEPKEQR